MHNFQHKKIVDTINRLDALPSDPQVYANWIKGSGHLALLSVVRTIDTDRVYLEERIWRIC